MKKLIIAGSIAIHFLSVSALAQVKPNLSANNHPNTTRPSSVSNSASRPTATDSDIPTLVSSVSQVWGNAPITNASARPRIAAATAKIESEPVKVSTAPTTISAPTTPSAPTQIYRVGVGDILDIQIRDSLSTRSTLFTVTDGGLLDYPLAGAPLAVGGLTTDAIAQLLRSAIKVLNNPEINVQVRDYASHTAKVIGFVSLPGDKVLRREAVPLYVVISQAMPLDDAVSVTIVRNGKDLTAIDLAYISFTNQTVLAGDVIKVSAQTPASSTEYFFAGGEVNAPGQKSFHTGLSLTQAIMASGGTSMNAGAVVRVSRQGSDGRLTAIEYNLRSIQNGKAADPLIQKNDRVEVSRDEDR
jgi:protein involved in polysaccharide export with SLBB domain